MAKPGGHFLLALFFRSDLLRKLLPKLLLYRRPLLNVHDSLPSGDPGSFPILRHQVRILIKHQDQAVLLGALENVGIAALEVRHYLNLASTSAFVFSDVVINR